jgi:hypothetical protein
MTGYIRTLAWGGLGALVGLLVFGFRLVAYALPEYATRTGDPCATCHVNPAGGGARGRARRGKCGSGEGGAGPALNGHELPAARSSDVIHNGRGKMLAFKFWQGAFMLRLTH